jgi:hypothetical protein
MSPHRQLMLKELQKEFDAWVLQQAIAKLLKDRLG